MQIIDKNICYMQQAVNMEKKIGCFHQRLNKFKVFNVPLVARTCSIVPQQDVKMSKKLQVL